MEENNEKKSNKVVEAIKRHKILTIIGIIVVLALVFNIKGKVDNNNLKKYEVAMKEQTNGGVEEQKTIAETESEDVDSEENTTEIPKVETTKANKKKKKSDSKVSADFKEMMDGYEEFFNEYVDFMKNYKSSDNILGMVADYGKYMNSYLSMMEKFEAIDKDELSTADAAYYVEVSGRILKKLAEIAQ